MNESLASVLNAAATAVVTYLLHSTLLLLVAWLVIRGSRTKSHALIEQIWKTAAVAGLITTSAHLSLGIASPVLRLPLAFENSNALSFAEGDSRPVPSETRPEVPLNADLHSKSSFPSVELFDTSIRRDSTVPKHPLESVPTTTDENVITRIDDVSIAQLLQVPVPETKPGLQTEIPPDDTGLPDTSLLPSSSDSEIASTTELTNVGQSAVEFLNRWSLAGTIAVAVAIVLLLLGRLLIQTFAFRRRVARLQPLESVAARTLLDQLLKQAGIRRRANLFTSNAYSEPVAFGIFRWRIVLPAGLDRELPREELRALLAHELAHLVRGDTIWLWIGHVLCSLLAFQPLNFLARRRWRQAAEFQCDDWAVRHAVAPLALARCLTRVAERRQTRRACVATLAAIGAKSTLSNRVERLVEETNRNDPWLRGRRRRFIELLTVLVISSLAIWGPCATMPALSQSQETMASNDAVGSQFSLNSRWIATFPYSYSMAEHADKAVAPPTRQDSADGNRDAAVKTNETVDELEQLQQELNEFVTETEALSREIGTRPELKPIIDRLDARIHDLRLRMNRLGVGRRSRTLNESSN